MAFLNMLSEMVLIKDMLAIDSYMHQYMNDQACKLFLVI